MAIKQTTPCLTPNNAPISGGLLQGASVATVGRKNWTTSGPWTWAAQRRFNCHWKWGYVISIDKLLSCWNQCGCGFGKAMTLWRASAKHRALSRSPERPRSSTTHVRPSWEKKLESDFDKNSGMVPWAAWVLTRSPAGSPKRFKGSWWVSAFCSVCRYQQNIFWCTLYGLYCEKQWKTKCIKHVAIFLHPQLVDLPIYFSQQVYHQVSMWPIFNQLILFDFDCDPWAEPAGRSETHACETNSPA